MCMRASFNAIKVVEDIIDSFNFNWRVISFFYKLEPLSSTKDLNSINL